MFPWLHSGPRRVREHYIPHVGRAIFPEYPAVYAMEPHRLDQIIELLLTHAPGVLFCEEELSNVEQKFPPHNLLANGKLC